MINRAIIQTDGYFTISITDVFHPFENAFNFLIWVQWHSTSHRAQFVFLNPGINSSWDYFF